jgi:hypothetical protein
VSGGELPHIKRQIRDETERMIKEGTPINGQVLPKNFVRIEVKGKGKNNLQVRVIYRDQAPYYFDMIPEPDPE